MFLFSTSNGFICDVSKINCAIFGVLIFLVLCLNVIGYMCGGNGSWVNNTSDVIVHHIEIICLSLSNFVE